MAPRHTHDIGLGLRIAGLALAAALTACDDGLGPASELSVFVSAPDFVVLGDTVELRGVAYNGSQVIIRSGSGCGPGIGFVVTDSAGVATDLHDGLGFLCPLLDSNEIEPGETDIEDWSWIPPATGTYQVHSHVHVRDGPTIESRRVDVVVVDPAAGS